MQKLWQGSKKEEKEKKNKEKEKDNGILPTPHHPSLRVFWARSMKEEGKKEKKKEEKKKKRRRKINN